MLRSEEQSPAHEKSHMKKKVTENKEKVGLKKQIPYLVANIVEILEIDQEDVEDGANVDLDF